MVIALGGIFQLRPSFQHLDDLDKERKKQQAEEEQEAMVIEDDDGECLEVLHLINRLPRYGRRYRAKDTTGRI